MTRTASGMNDTLPGVGRQAEVRSGVIRRWCARGTFMVVILLTAFVSSLCSFAQPPEFPPAEVLQSRPEASDQSKIPIKGILFLDKWKNPIFVPRMSYERLMELESGQKNQASRYIIGGIDIEGRVEENRAALSVTVRLTVDATGGETITIPLAMNNFHLLFPPEFLSGSEGGNQFAIEVNRESGGYQLLASTESDCEVEFRMQMSARVDTSLAQSLDFRLPLAPVTLKLTSDSVDAVGEIINRDDDAIRTVQNEAGRSEFLVESGGGRFTLRWGTNDRPASIPRLEVNSRVTMQWNSPQDQLIQNVQMELRDLRGSVSTFRIRIPDHAVLFDEPRLASSRQVIQSTRPDPKDERLFEITIPEAERRQRVDLELSLQIENQLPSQQNELELQTPTVVGALRQQGTIEIETGKDYRLRWRERPYVQNISSAGGESANDVNLYTFRFNRGSFSLPLWLGVTKRQVRIETSCDLELHDNYAELTMEIRSLGSGATSRFLGIDLADWQLVQVLNGRTGTNLPINESGDEIEVEMGTTGMEELIPVLVKARYLLQNDPGGTADSTDSLQRIDLGIPRVVANGEGREPVTIQEAVVQVTGKGRQALVIDLERSQNLERIVSATGDASTRMRSFRVLPPEAPARLVGEFVEQPPRLIMSASATAELVGNQIETIVNWTVESQVDLKGRLRIAVPRIPASSEGEDTNDDGDSTVSPAQAGEWSVVVNNDRDESNAALLRNVRERDDPEGPDSASVSSAADASSDNQGDTEGDSPEASSGQDQEADAGPLPASADPGFRQQVGSAAGLQIYDLVSDSLGDESVEIRFRRLSTLPEGVDPVDATTSLSLPYPLVEDVTLRGEVELQLLGDSDRDLRVVEPALSNRVTFSTLPIKPVPLRITPRAPVKNELDVQTIVIRSAISEAVQHDQVIASVVGAGEFEIQTRSDDEPEFEVSVDGTAVTVSRIDDRFLIPIPDDAQRHVVDLRLWVERADARVLRDIRPLVQFAPNSDRLYWQVTVPANEHLVWASASSGRAMQWFFDRWRLVRRPLMTDSGLVNRVLSEAPVTIDPSPMPSGNRYLFRAMDSRSFRVKTASHTLLWIIVASAVVIVGSVLTYLPWTRSPLSAILAAVVFAGVLAVVPDCAVMIGQIALLSMLLVIVMLSIRSLVLPTPSRVLNTTVEPGRDLSARSGSKSVDVRARGSSATHSITPEDVVPETDQVAT
jgi:hypothetical protein